MDLLEQQSCFYILGLPGNRRLKTLSAPWSKDVATRWQRGNKEKLRRFFQTRYGARSWSKERLVIARVEASRQGTDVRFIVTNLSGRGKHLYEKVYCARGRMENLIKEHKLYPKSDRTRLGDWEADTIVGRKGEAALITLAERKSRFCLVGKVENRTALQATKAIKKTLTPLHDRVHTVTYDNGMEFAQHREINQALGSKSFFAHPFHSWERGTNENMNGLLRQYFPKGKFMEPVTQSQIEHAVQRLNNRPRKCLGFKTPNQVFNEIKPDVALAN
jgi:transposase, IS30 family